MRQVKTRWIHVGLVKVSHLYFPDLNVYINAHKQTHARTHPTTHTDIHLYLINFCYQIYAQSCPDKSPLRILVPFKPIICTSLKLSELRLTKEPMTELFPVLNVQSLFITF